MARWLILTALVIMVVAAPASAAGITGQYLEARTCEVYTGPCFANADTGLTGKQAVLAWKIDKGSAENVTLDGLSIVAVISASETLGLRQTGTSRAILIVDEKADASQREALIRLARNQAGDLLSNVIAVETAPISLNLCDCKEGGCAQLRAGAARIETRCINTQHDKTCGNEFNYYPPLAKDVKAQAAMVIDHSYTGSAFNETWKDSERRGAYLGSFEAR